jgi:hypothetical protein
LASILSADDSDIITRVFFFYLSKVYPTGGYIAVGYLLFLQEQTKDHHHHHRERERGGLGGASQPKLSESSVFQETRKKAV